MKLTNNYGIPEIIIRAMGESYAPKIGRVAVTALIDSPLIRFLKIKHWDELKEDASSKLWSVLGQAAHEIIERGRVHTDKVEEYMKAFVYGMTVTGRSDIVIGDELIDLKVTSVYSFLLGEKENWKRQLNVYKYLAKSSLKRDINKARIYGILRDWQESKKWTQRDYPETPFFQTEVDLWSLDFIEKYIEERVALHQIADHFLEIKADPPPEIYCTDAERWKRPNTFAVKKKKQKKAVRVLDTFEEANKWMIDNAKTGSEFFIEERPGFYVRCEKFCPCEPVCPLCPPIHPEEEE